MIRRGLCQVALLGCLLATAGDARAELDIADLFLRKIQRGEKTFYQGGGWQHWRTRWELFYEPNYYFMPNQALAGYSTGAFVLLTRPRSEYQLTLFTLHDSLSRTDDEWKLMYAYLPFFAPLAPQIVTDGDGAHAYQGMSGVQFRTGQWLDASYGVVSVASSVNGERTGSDARSFIHANLPLAYLRSNAVVNNTTGETERSQFAFRYDEATWARFIELGRTQLGDQLFWNLNFERLGGFVNADLRFTENMEPVSLQFGVQASKFKVASQQATGKFGSAWDMRFLANVLWPSRYDATMPDAGVKPGLTAELYYQMPATSWFAIFNFLLGAQSAALSSYQGKEEEAARTREETVASTQRLFEAASEDDRVYGGLTLGITRNDPQMFRSTGITDTTQVYIHFRLFY